VQVIHTAAALGRVPVGEPILAQRYLPPDGPDHKIYRVGDARFCVLRRWPARSYADKLGKLAPLDGELRRLTDLCGAALGIDLASIEGSGPKGQILHQDVDAALLRREGRKPAPAKATRDVIDLAVGSDLATVQWASDSGWTNYFQVFTAFAPRLKRDFDGRVGFMHATTGS
jgi:hypothetical protein